MHKEYYNYVIKNTVFAYVYLAGMHATFHNLPKSSVVSITLLKGLNYFAESEYTFSSDGIENVLFGEGGGGGVVRLWVVRLWVVRLES